MAPRTNAEIETRVLAMNGKFTQAQVSIEVGISLPTIRAICRRNNVTWICQAADQCGENNHNYQGGVGRSTIERLTRRVVLASGRSLIICERCGDKNKVQEHPRHHKDRNRSNNEPNNIEVLCIACHNIEHNKEKIRDEQTGRFT